MKYRSTRGKSTDQSFEQAVLAGLAPDGGLYIPESIPSLPKDWETTWAGLTFQQLAFNVLSMYIDESEIPHADLRKLIDASYSTFRHKDITPLHLLKQEPKTYVLELFHGPTFAFKDVALQFLGNLFEYFLERRNQKLKEAERVTVVGATSGDTGSAAIYGLRGKKNISVFILHPKGRVSPIQEAQMTTVLDPNVHNLAVGGTFDDCQDIVKALFADVEFNKEWHLGAINSINWARILAQIVYYFHSYFTLLKELGVKPGSEEAAKVLPVYCVPTGNFGDILAGYYAKRMGLPIAKLVVSTNENDILDRFWKTGRYEKRDPSQDLQETIETGGDGKQATADGANVKETLSPAMDILVSSNFERLLWYLAYECEAGNDAQKAGDTLAQWMGDVKTKGQLKVSPAVLEAAKRDFSSERVSDQQTLETVTRYFEPETKDAPYILDPHTAIGVAASERQKRVTGQIDICLATAHPAKFNAAVEKALANAKGFDFEKQVLPKEFRGLLQKERRVIPVAKADIELVKKVIVEEIGKEPKA